jgi:nucleoside-diphosphate-sugar epimerase
MHVVTGATGHLGCNLVPALLDAGHRVRVVTIEPLDQPVPALAGLDVERVHGTVEDGDALRRAFAGADVVNHLAAVISTRLRPDPRLQAVNVHGVENVTNACIAAGVGRMVHVSSVHALSTGSRIPAYDRSKAAGERVVRAAMAKGLDALIIRPTGIIGPRDFAPSRMGRVFLDLAHRRLPALLAGGFNWVDVRDVCKAIVAASTRGRTGETYMVSGYWRSVKDLGLLAGSITGVRPPLVTLPQRVARVVAPVGGLLSERFSPASLRALRDFENVECDLALRDLDHWPRPLTDTVADLYRWFDEVGLGTHRGRITPSMAGGKTTVTARPISTSLTATELIGAPAAATTLPTNLIPGASSSSTTTTLYGASSA